MRGRRQRYVSLPWTEAARRRAESERKKAFLSGLAGNLCCLFMGAGAMLLIALRIPLPWW